MMFRLLPLLLLTIIKTATAQDCEACLFDGNDPDTCIIYGKVGDQVIEWNTGSRECKGYWGIAISSIDPNSSCQSTNAFVNSIRFGDLQSSDSKLGLGVSSEGGAFFTQNADANNRIDLVDEITIDGEVTSCQANENSCYGAMRPYFDAGEGAKEMAQVCDKLFNQVRVDRNLEESTLRIRICMELKDSVVIPLECNPLAVQVGDLEREDPDLDCSGYGFETPLSSVPGCENALESTSASSGGDSGGDIGGGSTTSSGGSQTGTVESSGNMQQMTTLSMAISGACAYFMA